MQNSEQEKDTDETQLTSTYDVSDTLKNYFNPVNSMIDESPEVVNSKAELDYFLSKRFLITSYNNLRSIDPSLHDHKVIKKKLSVLKELHKMYNNVSGVADVSLVAFEMIFLRAQPEYLQFIKDKEDLTSSITVLTTLIDSLSPEINQGEAKLKKMDKSDKAKKKLEDMLKPLRGSYVDAIYEKSEAEKKLLEMKDLKAIYTEKYFDTFVSELSELSGEYKKVIAKILNHKAYELDQEIWKHASKSKLIKEYFSYAGIEGDYSTRTFLGYYLKTLDKSMLGEKQKELFKLLEYLKKQHN